MTRLSEQTKQRLTVLADFLEKLPRDRFDYNHWVGVGWQGKDDLSCGTTACALGWAATIPAFKPGLAMLATKLNRHYEPLAAPVFVPEFVVDGEVIYDPFRAAAMFFGLSWEAAHHLFSPGAHEEEASGEYVAAKLRAFVAKNSDGGYDESDWEEDSDDDDDDDYDEYDDEPPNDDEGP